MYVLEIFQNYVIIENIQDKINTYIAHNHILLPFNHISNTTYFKYQVMVLF